MRLTIMEPHQGRPICPPKHPALQVAKLGYRRSSKTKAPARLTGRGLPANPPGVQQRVAGSRLSRRNGKNWVVRSVSRPFETTRGGYQITMRAGRVTETFGSKDGVRHGGPPPAPQRAQEGAAQSGKHRAAAMDALAAGITGGAGGWVSAARGRCCRSRPLFRA
jgi:hypothetical protein